MSNSKFLQIHTLTSYPGTLLNRDDAGFAKRLPFGGSTRTRVSSQCLKYHWRNFEGENALYNMEVPRSYRSRETFQRRVATPLIENNNYPENLVLAGTFALKELLLTGKPPGKSEIKKLLLPEDDQNSWEQMETSQITIFGEPELRYLRELISKRLDALLEQYPSLDGSISEAEEEAINEAVKTFTGKDKELRDNLKALRTASGLDAAMFGRMVTSDVLARGDAAIHVAHSFTTHEEESESDYFSAVDELRRDEPEESGELGAGHINSTELSSGLFYQYVVIDLPLLISNIEGVAREDWMDSDKTLAKETIRRMVHLIATVSPGAKLGSTAPYSYAQCMLVESGSAQPRTLANAFEKAVPKNGEGILSNSYKALGRYASELDAMYDLQFERRLAGIGPIELLREPLKLEDTVSVGTIADWASQQTEES